MAKLTDEQRREVWAERMRYMSREGIETAENKWETLEAIGALDDYLDDNAAAVEDAKEGVTLDGKGVEEAVSKADVLLEERKGGIKDALPVESRGALDDGKLPLLVGMVMQRRDMAFAPEIAEPVDDGDEPVKGGG